MKQTEPQGCLAAILGLFGIRLGGAPQSSARSSSARTDAAQAEAVEQFPYRLRDDFLSPAELSFYRVLQLALKDQTTITTKVNLADIFFVSGASNSQSYRNKIDRKHVDFLLCDPVTMKPRCGIELDDSSHSRRNRQERDQLVDAVFQAAGLPLVHFPVRSSYDPHALTAELTQHLGVQPPPVAIASPISAPAASAATGSPNCPKCNLPMVKRTASKGQNAGQQFWGCVNYPKCRQVG